MQKQLGTRGPRNLRQTPTIAVLGSGKNYKKMYSNSVYIHNVTFCFRFSFLLYLLSSNQNDQIWQLPTCLSD